MKLSAYLSEKKITDTTFALAIGVTRSMVTKLKNGSAKPSADTALAIAKVTGDAVGLADLVTGRAAPGSEPALPDLVTQ